MNLSKQQQKHLRKEGMELSPIFQIGKNGLSEEQIKSINEALETRELIKISLLQNTDETPKEVAEVIAEQTQANVIQVIGKTVVLFKKSSHEDNRRISLEMPQN